MKRKQRYQGKRTAPLTKKQRFWAEWGYLFLTALVVIVLFRVVLQLAWVPSGSMEATIPTRSMLVSMRLPYMMGDPQPERGDVVTFWSDEMDKLLVKRVVGLPGDKVSFSGGYVYVNDEKLDEPYLRKEGSSVSANKGEFVVPEGCLFFLGDNRLNSDDARYWDEPFIPLEKVRARGLLVISVHKENIWRGIRAIA